MNDTGYRSPDEPSDARLDRLEASVRAGRVERVVSMLRFGLNALFILAGFSGLLLAGASLLVFAAVHASNMAKAPNGVVIRREDGKVLKPEGWEPPTEAIRAILVKDGWTGDAT